jgi:hypothetical protein
MLALYAVTIFLGAGLLFLVQPMFARMVLPLLGGAPAVWNTALVFYQAALLAGYAYAHAEPVWLGIRRQAVVHLGLMLLPLLVLPLGVPAGWTPPAAANPIPWLLAIMVLAVGLPFFVVSTTSPLVQKWLTATGHPAAVDPYFLYAASNLGSMLALLSYPALVERHLRLPDQSRLWTAGYLLLVLLAAGCVACLWRSRSQPAAVAAADDPAPKAGVGAGRRARWVLLSFVPSSLMLSVTTFLSTDIAAIPLLWVIPLAVYLLTFILVFARRPPLPHALMGRALPVVVLPLVLILTAGANEPLALVIPPHLLTFFVAAMVCHGELARDRPGPRHLTEFYLWLSVGGVLGGIFTALVAPLVFTRVAEYPLMLVLACVLAAGPDLRRQGRAGWALALGLPAGLGLLAAALLLLIRRGDHGPAGAGLAFGLLVVLCFLFSWRRPLAFGLGIGVILAASAFHRGEEGRLLHAERSFFGIHRVTRDASDGYHLLLHGTTLHGMQSLDPARRREPLTYFYPNGPLGQLFLSLPRRSVAVVGLGAGSIACYAAPGQVWTFYEIDPAVERIARDARFFTFLQDCLPGVPVVLGDARLSLARAPDATYDLLVLDAYSSDAPPMHLLTREALALYLAKLAPRGLLVFNVSNRHLDLEPVLAGLARDGGLAARVRDDAAVRPEDSMRGKTPSTWVVMARALADLGALAADPRWQPLRGDPGDRVWTDSYGSLLAVFKWR